MLVLGIETSCDETAIGLYETKRGLMDHHLYSQIDLHAQYGGVVPELAARDHIRKLPILVKQLLARNKINFNQINGVAYTKGPGLIGALMVGACYAKGLAYGLNIPSLGVHHMEGHLLSVMLEDERPKFPFLALLVSGGHTQIVYVENFGKYQILGQSIDDAVGEAFDKTAKLMGLPYPGGPNISKLAQIGDAKRFKFSHPMTDRKDCMFSFSGLKTQALNVIEQHKPEDYPDIAASFQLAIVETLRKKCHFAIEQTHCKRLVISGGVGANTLLRQTFKTFFGQKGIEIFYPRSELCTDNGAMIAYVGHQRFLRDEKDPEINPLVSRWSLESLS